MALPDRSLWRRLMLFIKTLDFDRNFTVPHLAMIS